MDLQELRERLRWDESVRERISRRAFDIYANRGYVGGREAEDWLQAENEILQQLIDEETQRMAMDQAALEPDVRREEPLIVSTQASSSATAKKSESKAGAAKVATKKASPKKAASTKAPSKKAPKTA